MSILPVSVSNLAANRAGRRILGPVDTRIDAGTVTMVIGPNGAGKTTFLRALHGLDRASGEVRWATSRGEALGRQAFIFQQPILMRRSVLSNIAYPLRLAGTPRREARERAEHWARRVGLEGKLAQGARSLSGGERQKLALARAMIREPELLILDEPTAHLDGRATREVEEILDAAILGGTTLVMATHDMGQARRLGTHVLFLTRGQITESGRISDFFDAPATPEARIFTRGDILE